MAKKLKVEIGIVGVSEGVEGKTAEVVVRRGIKNGVKLDIRILLLGKTGHGKTTLLGVLTSGKLDDGKAI